AQSREEVLIGERGGGGEDVRVHALCLSRPFSRSGHALGGPRSADRPPGHRRATTKAAALVSEARTSSRGPFRSRRRAGAARAPRESGPKHRGWKNNSSTATSARHAGPRPSGSRHPPDRAIRLIAPTDPPSRKPPRPRPRPRTPADARRVYASPTPGRLRSGRAPSHADPRRPHRAQRHRPRRPAGLRPPAHTRTRAAGGPPPAPPAPRAAARRPAPP